MIKVESQLINIQQELDYISDYVADAGTKTQHYIDELHKEQDKGYEQAFVTNDGVTGDLIDVMGI